MQVCKSGAVGVHLEHRALAKNAAIHCGSIQGIAGYNHSGHRKIAVAVGAREITGIGGETMQVRKARAIQVEPEHGATAELAAAARRPEEGVARQNQSALERGSVAVGIMAQLIGGSDGEAVQVGKGRPIGVDRKHRAMSVQAAKLRRSIKSVAGQQQIGSRTVSITVGINACLLYTSPSPR